MSFEDWMFCVEHLIEKYSGLGIDTLPDQPYFELYKEGITPSEMASNAINYAAKGEWI